MKTVNKELQLFACLVHGFLGFGHLLGIVYNARRKNKLDTVVHTLGLCYDARCAYKHYKALKEG